MMPWKLLSLEVCCFSSCHIWGCTVPPFPPCNMLLPQSSLLGGSTRFLVVPNIPNFRPHTHARILTYLGDDPPAYCRQAYSTLSRLGPALPPNNGEANRQLGKRQEALSSSLRSVLRAALLIASLASSLLSCIKLHLLMFLFVLDDDEEHPMEWFSALWMIA